MTDEQIEAGAQASRYDPRWLTCSATRLALGNLLATWSAVVPAL